MIIQQKDDLNATPSKGIYESLIADYGIETAVAELVDNAIDVWIKRGRKKTLTVQVEFNLTQKTIIVKDDAGGIPESELAALVSPGSSSNMENEKTIGVFGVGSKRAVVTLSQDIEIQSHYKGEDTNLIKYDDAWLKSDSWYIPHFKASDIQVGTTVIELRKLRTDLDSDQVLNVKNYLSRIYGEFLKGRKFSLLVDDEKIKPITYEKWAFPKNYTPQEYSAPVRFADGNAVKFKGVAGLRLEEGSIAGEYGVYFYCNNRLIGNSIRDREVGFLGPHHGISLVRVVVFLEGPAKYMPWTSNKAALNYASPTFKAIQNWILDNVSYFSRISRALIKEWNPESKSLATGQVVQYKASNIETPPIFYRPDPPRMRFSYKAKALTENKKIFEKSPHSKGLLEAMIAVEIIYKDKSLSQKNRICLILLDSTLEIAFKDFLLNNPTNPIGINQLKKVCPGRPDLHREIKSRNVISVTAWPRIEKYYTLRCELIHQKSDAIISNPDIEDFRKIVETALNKMFGLRCPH